MYKTPEKINLQCQKADQWLSEVGVEGWGLARKGDKGTFWSDGHVLYHNCVGYRAIKIFICTFKMLHFIVNFVSK